MKFIFSIIVTLAFFLLSSQASASEKVIPPEHGVLSQEGTDWVCELGYRKDFEKDMCIKVVVPERGRLSRFGDSFECERGYLANRENWTCEEIKLPENGVLTAAGNDWRCIATYRREGDKCVKVELPENAEFFEQGYDFFCKNQYRKVGQRCEKFEIPPNGYLTFMGNDWQCHKGYVKNAEKQSCDPIFVPLRAQANFIGGFDCDPGYEKRGSECIKVPDVENGRYFERGIDFYCLSGFRKNEELRKCEKIEIPANARAGSTSLDGWICNSGYIKEGAGCKKFDLPEHARWGVSTWVCEAGYERRPGSNDCHKIHIPENAHANESFDGWDCDEEFTKNYRENRCNAQN